MLKIITFATFGFLALSCTCQKGDESFTRLYILAHDDINNDTCGLSMLTMLHLVAMHNVYIELLFLPILDVRGSLLNIFYFNHMLYDSLTTL